MIVPALMERARQGRELGEAEVAELTRALLQEGEPFDRSAGARPRVALESSAAAGDKVALVVAPIIASLGVAVPIICGTDWSASLAEKLESVPHLRTNLSRTESQSQLDSIGCMFARPGDDFLASAGRVSDTDYSAGLRAALTMSRVLVSSPIGVVVDLRYGSAAPIADAESAAVLSSLLRATGESLKCPTTVVTSEQSTPIGRAIGKSLELEEAIHALQGTGDAPEDLMDAVFALGCEMLMLAGVANDHAAGHAMILESIAGGAALEQMKKVIEAQGGNPAIVDDPALLPQSSECEVFRASRKGHVLAVSARALSDALLALGSAEDHSVGFMLTVKPGDWVDTAEAIATVFARDAAGVDVGRAALASAINIGDKQ